MELIIIAVVAFYFGFKIAEIVHVSSFKKILNDLKISEQQLRDLVQKNGLDLDQDEAPEESFAAKVEIKIEQHLGQLYVYELGSDRFVAQGKTSDEIMQRIVDSYPKGTRVICTTENGGLILSAAAERLKAQTL
jgi:hypothetical protein